jgi:hypothetical protein
MINYWSNCDFKSHVTFDDKSLTYKITLIDDFRVMLLFTPIYYTHFIPTDVACFKWIIWEAT